MNYRIITDSSSDMLSLESVDFTSVPLKIITSEKEYIDDESLDVSGMIEDLRTYSGRSSSSCPNVGDWLDSFEGAENVFCITITKNLSGSYNSASTAVNEFLSENEKRKGYVVDTLSVGPECCLIIQKIKELIESKIDFDAIVERINEYKKGTHLIFALESLRNLANNGRCSHAVAKISGMLGIRVIGKASSEGTLELTDKVRGIEKTLQTIVKNMQNIGYSGGKVRIHHCENEEGAKSLKEKISLLYPAAEVIIEKTRALCSFYAEKGGLLVGFEGGLKA